MEKIAVIAGTPIDTLMGAEFLKSKRIRNWGISSIWKSCWADKIPVYATGNKRIGNEKNNKNN